MEMLWRVATPAVWRSDLQLGVQFNGASNALVQVDCRPIQLGI